MDTRLALCNVRFEVWRTLTIGGVPADKLLERLEDAGHSVSEWAKDIMGKPKFTTLPEPTQIRLAKTKVRDLGFTEMPTTIELFARIKEVGDLCPAEVGPHLRLADRDQPKGTWYRVAMEPIFDSGGFPNVFGVYHYAVGLRCLRADCAGPDDRWDLGCVVVFRLRPPVGEASR